MVFKKRTNSTTCLKALTIGLILLSCITSIFISNVEIDTNYDFNQYNNEDLDLETQNFDRSDYDSILDTEEHGLGEISISDMNFDNIDNLSFYLLGDVYPLLDDYTVKEYGQVALNMTFKDMKFISSVRNARTDNLNPNITDNLLITVRVNESINVWCNLSKTKSEGYLIYHPRFYPSQIKDLWVQRNDTNKVIQCNETSNYIIDQYNFMKFEYKDVFKERGEFRNFTMHVIWEYNLTISGWKIIQDRSEKFLLEDDDETISPKFSYKFDLSGKRIADSELVNFADIENWLRDADNIEANVTIIHPDRNHFENYALEINGNSKSIINLLNDDGSISTGFYTADQIDVDLNFTCDYTIEFEDAVEDNWGVDRLYKDKNKRERLYFPSVTSGPEHLYIKYLSFLEDSISFDQVTSNTTQFGRSISYSEAVVHEFEEDIENSLIFTKNATQTQGLLVRLPYLILGETCPTSIKYRASQNLKVVIMDNIQIPIQGILVELYFKDVLYGTYLSDDLVHPLAPTITDQNGEIYVRYVPNGNYTVKVLLNDKVVAEKTVNSFSDVNYVITKIPHFPLWILIFGSINGTLALVGIILYLRFKRQQK